MLALNRDRGGIRVRTRFSIAVAKLAGIALGLILVCSVSFGGVGGTGGGSTCCDCWQRIVEVVCTPAGCTTNVVWEWVDCQPAGGGTGGGDTGGGSGGGGDQGGGGGGGIGHPDDDTPEARFESEMCQEDNVLIVNHCSHASPQIQCCILNSDDGHSCTACNCAGCCDTYWDCNSQLTQTMCWGCKSDCAVEFSGGGAAGTDDSSECDRFDGNPFM